MMQDKVSNASIRPVFNNCAEMLADCEDPIPFHVVSTVQTLQAKQQ